MNYNFLANQDDKMRVLNFLFENTDLQVYDSYSEYSQKICRYKSSAAIAAKFDLENGGRFALTFQLWSPRFGGKARFSKIDLNPRYCNGHAYRYSTGGWGLIQLYLGGCQASYLFHSHLGHFNEKGALSRAENNKDKEEVSRCNWKEIMLTSSQLKRAIYKMSIRKQDGMDVLSGADILSKSGVTLQY